MEISSEMTRKRLLQSAILASVLVINGCGADEITVERQVPSPSGSYIASFYVIAGGGAAGYVLLRVNVRKGTEPFKPYKGDIFEMRHAYEAGLTWPDDQHLVIVYPNVADIYKKEPKAGDISISYTPKPTVDQYYLRSSHSAWLGVALSFDCFIVGHRLVLKF